MKARRALRIAVPWLADSVAGLGGRHAVPRLPAAEWLFARGRSGPRDAGEWRDWLIAGCGLRPGVLREFAAGPSSRAAQGPVDAQDRCWARAEPVHLLTAIDHLQLAAPVPLALDADESAALLRHLGAHLDGTGYALHPSADGGWLCSCPAGSSCETLDPLAALGRNLRECLPTGRDAVRLRALVNELQMLLHEHPVNERRAALGRPVVNSVWIWGIGTIRTPAGSVTGDLLTDDAWLAGFWRLHGGRVGPVAALAEALAQGEGDLRVAVARPADAPHAAGPLERLETDLFSIARDALLGSRAARVSVWAGNRTVEVTPAARWAAWRRPRSLDEVLA